MNFNLTNTTTGSYSGVSRITDSERVGRTMLAVVIVVMALLGNTLVICAVVYNHRMRTITNYLIVNVSVCDLLYTIIVTPVQMVEIFELYHWALGSFSAATLFCKVTNFLQLTFVTSSLLTFSALAVDRYFAVMSPLRRKITKKMFLATLSCVWLVASCVCFPVFHAMKVKNVNGTLSCMEKWADDEQKSTFLSRTYTVTLFVIMYCVPLLATTISYSRISWFLWLRRTPGTQLEVNQRYTDKSKKKVIKMLITVVVLFVCCWLPLQIVTFVVFYHGPVSPHWYTLCTTLMCINACLNPIIYAIFSENYREAFKNILLSWMCCRRSSRKVPFPSARSTTVSNVNNYSKVSPNSVALEMSAMASDSGRNNERM